MSKNANLIIVGAGQYGHLVKEIAELMSCYEKIEYVDDNSEEAIGKISDLEKLSEGYENAIVAIGNPDIREKMMGLLIEYQYNIATIIHPQSVISKSSRISKGCVIEAGAILNTDVQLDDGVFISSGAVVNHNSHIGKFSHIDCNSVVESGCNVPAKLKIHSGEVFLKEMSEKNLVLRKDREDKCNEK